jgi:hypothetical protein
MCTDNWCCTCVKFLTAKCFYKTILTTELMSLASSSLASVLKSASWIELGVPKGLDKTWLRTWKPRRGFPRKTCIMNLYSNSYRSFLWMSCYRCGWPEPCHSVTPILDSTLWCYCARADGTASTRLSGLTGTYELGETRQLVRLHHYTKLDRTSRY